MEVYLGEDPNEDKVLTKSVEEAVRVPKCVNTCWTKAGIYKQPYTERINAAHR
jgi:hypothetical protein